jgi:beta-phosphoglucomutase-like phosphatase (HAD superfamily)
MRIKTGRCVLGDLPCAVTSVIFSVDAIVDSAPASAAAWKTVLDVFLRSHAAVRETEFEPFHVRADYLRYMRGKSRVNGARDFLASRDITLPYDDLRGLAMSQEEYFLAEVRRHGLVPFRSTITLARDLRRRGVRTAAVSVHRDGGEMLGRAGAAGLFDLVMDGLDAPGTAVPEHPDAHLYLQAAERLHAPPERTAVIEECAAGVSAAREGGFRAVVGVDRTDGCMALAAHGADLVIDDLSRLRLRSADAA